VIPHHLDGETVGSCCGIYIDPTSFHRRTRLPGMFAFYKVAFIAKPARTVPESQSFIKSAEKYIAFQFRHDLLRVAV
jgi:hypothetical protein